MQFSCNRTALLGHPVPELCVQLAVISQQFQAVMYSRNRDCGEKWHNSELFFIFFFVLIEPPHMWGLTQKHGNQVLAVSSLKSFMAAKQPDHRYRTGVKRPK
jgi:hypothetical protein